jgi:hypothetical protein
LYRSSLQGIQFICYLGKIILQVVLYNYETWFLTLREENKYIRLKTKCLGKYMNPRRIKV